MNGFQNVALVFYAEQAIAKKYTFRCFYVPYRFWW